ncbi:MAG: amidase family protein, partial [Povalibacter sp.]
RELTLTRGFAPQLRIGVPPADQLQFFGDAQYERLFTESCTRASANGAKIVQMDFSALFETARLLYEGPWVAERYAAIENFIATHAAAMHPVTAAIIGKGNKANAVDAFKAQYRLQALRRKAQALWSEVDALLVPSAGTIYTIEQMEADPITLNSNLGYYTNFVNLLDMAALAIPSGFTADGLPFGVTLIASAGRDYALVEIGSLLHRESDLRLGTSDEAIPQFEQTSSIPAGHIAVAVCGAHMSGLPLNTQLTSRHAFRLRATRTAPRYRFYALPGGPPHRPGLVRVNKDGSALDVEVWAVPAAQFGSFVDGIPSPLGIGKVELEDGSWCSGFVCESWGVEGASEITQYGGWRQYLARGA